MKFEKNQNMFFFCKITDDKIAENSNKNVNKFLITCAVFHVFYLIIWIVKVLSLWQTIMIYLLIIINAVYDIFWLLTICCLITVLISLACLLFFNNSAYMWLISDTMLCRYWRSMKSDVIQCDQIFNRWTHSHRKSRIRSFHISSCLLYKYVSCY